MKTFAPIFGGLLALLPGLVAQEPVRTASPEFDLRIDLRILVTGVEGSKRLADFRDFLSRQFKVVGTTDYSGFKPEHAKGYDVVVFDAELKPTPGRIGLPKPPSLPKDFARASVLVSGGGAILARPLGLKTDWG